MRSPPHNYIACTVAPQSHTRVNIVCMAGNLIFSPTMHLHDRWGLTLADHFSLSFRVTSSYRRGTVVGQWGLRHAPRWTAQGLSGVHRGMV